MLVKNKITSLEIAELSSKRHADIIRSIKSMEESWIKVNQRSFALVKYTDSKGQKRPMYELTKTECLYIATKFNDEARAKLILRWEKLEKEKQKPLSTLDMLELSVKSIRENKEEIQDLKNDMYLLKRKTETNPDYFTIAGYGTLNNISINLKLASSLGVKASSLCRKRGLKMDSIPDPRFGKVRMYPTEILQEVFSNSL